MLIVAQSVHEFFTTSNIKAALCITCPTSANLGRIDVVENTSLENFTSIASFSGFA